MTGSFASALAEALETDWRATARPSQLPPEGDWIIWLLLAGRGFGKTRVLSEWVCDVAQTGRARRIALVAPTASDARDVLVEGASGIMAVAPAWFRPVYEPTRRRLVWPNGALAVTYSADEPERLRGPQHDAAVCDDLAAWRYPEAWDMLQFGLRLGSTPRCVVATTPKPTRLIRDLLAREGKDVIITRGTSFENRANLAPSFFQQIVGKYEGTRLGRQELLAEVLLDTPGALWNLAQLDACRAARAPDLTRIVVAIDPATTSGENADETGIIVAGLGTDGHAYILDDRSGRMAPIEWARAAIGAYHAHAADRIVAEVNAGGEMVEATLRMVDPSIPFTAVRASRGKIVRAEPVAALYEQNRIHHVGTFGQLEEQMTAFTPDFDRASAGYSPDRVDALVWAITELMVAASEPGLWSRSLMLFDGEPVAMPPVAELGLFYATIGIDGGEGQVAACYWSQRFSGRGRAARATLVLLDVDVAPISELAAFLPGIRKRLIGFETEHRPRQPVTAALWAAPMIAQEFAAHGTLCNELPASLLAVPAMERSTQAAGSISRGLVQMAVLAFEKSQQAQYQVLARWRHGETGGALAEAIVFGVLVGL